MISKKLFMELMKELRQELSRQERIEAGLQILLPSSFVSIENRLFDRMVELLEFASNDKYDSINYFIWEHKWGERDKPFCTEEDGTEIWIKSIEELYDYLKSNQQV